MQLGINLRMLRFGAAFLAVFFIFSSFFITSVVQAAESDAAVYLLNNQRADGALAGNADIATARQATAEALIALDAPDTVRSDALAFLLATPLEQQSTGQLSRLIVLKPHDVGNAMTELLSRQNRDGGFGGYAGYDSNPLDTALALEALATTGQLQRSAAGHAVSFLLGSQLAGGGWRLGANTPSVSVSSVVLRALWQYRHVYNVSQAVQKADEFLVSQRNAAALWSETWLTAIALDALLPITPNKSIYNDSIAALEAAQQPDGSWGQDVYITALAMQALQAAQADYADYGSYAGRVLDGDSSLPLAGVTVTLSGTATGSVVTDASGKFVFDKLLAGEYTLQITLPDYSSLTLNAHLAAGQDVLLGDISLFKQADATTAVVRGQITDSQSNMPLAGVQVSVANSNLATVTDAQGNYQIVNIPPGDIVLQVTKTGYLTAQAQVQLVAGQTLIFSPQLQKAASQKVSVFGVVSSAADATPLAGVTITVTHPGGTVTAQTVVDGSYAINNLPAGLIQLQAAKPGYQAVSGSLEAQHGARINFSPVMTLEGEEPPAPTTGHVSGVVIDSESGQTLQGVTVRISIPGKPTVTATTDMEGRFVLEAEPGEATIALIKSGYQTLTGTVEIAAGVTVDIGTAELVPNDLAHYAAITGQVVDAVTGTPLEGVRVAARLEGRYYSDYSDENGDFELRYLSFFSGNVELTLEGYRSIDLGVILTKGEVLDFGVLTMRKEEVDNLLPDIMPQILGKDALTVDAMNYQANGAFHAAITNAGNSPAVGDIEIVAFSDSNDNAVYDEGLDTRLGSKALALSLPVSGSVEFDITVNGQLPFRDAPILLQIDIANTIPEGSENNNTATTAGICSAREDGGIAIDLLLCMDRSGSVGGSNFTMQLEGTAAALEDSSIIPRNGTVRISLLTFSSYTRVEIPPTIVTQSNAETLAQAVRDVRYTAGGTSIHSCLYKAVDVLTSLQQRAEVSVIDLATDGGSCGSCAENASDEAKAAGVDVLNALAVGRGANVALLKRIVYPQPPGGDQGFVVEIEDFEDYAAAIASNMRNETRVSDFSAGNLQLIDNGPGQPVSITLRVGNGGTLTSPAGAVVEFHAVDAGGADTLLGSVVLEPLAGGDYQDIRLDGVESLADAVSVYAIVDPAGVARECNTANNRLETSVSTKLASLQVATDAAVYGPQMPVLLSGQISNEGSLAGNFTVALRIVDNNGNVMAAFVGLDADAVDPGGNTSVTADWNTAHYLAGNYTLEGTLYGEQGEVLDTASADFEIRHTQDESPAITLQVSPDQHEYHTTATAIINSQVVNESTNVLLNDARLAISVASSSGATVFTKTTIMGSLVPQAVRAVADPYAFSDIVQGKYTITGQVLNAAGQVLARDTANFIVNEDKRLSLSGEVTAQYPELFQGDAQLCTAVIHNDGTLNLSSQPVRRLVANLADEQVVQGNEMVITLAAGESRTFMRDVTTGNLALGQHACVLQARINGQWHDLAYDTFKVLEPPVEIIPALAVGNLGRVLVLLDGGCEAHGKQAKPSCNDEPYSKGNAPNLPTQRAELETLLEESGWSYTIVTSADDFAQQMHSNGYVLYAVLSEQIKLPENIQQELTDRVAAGAGLIVAGNHDRRNGRIEEALGLKSKGKMPYASGVWFSPSVLLPQGAQAAFPVDGKPLAMTLNTAQSLGEYQVERGKQSIAAAYNSYENGETVYLGFDWLLQATALRDNNALATLFTNALSAVHPEVLTPIAGHVMPVTLTVTNEGVAVEARARFNLPSGMVVIDPGQAQIDQNGYLVWNFNLAEDEEQQLHFWVRLPQTTGDTELSAGIQVWLNGEWQDHANANLVIRVVPAP